MDAGALLDLLGNENRRRILRLLSRKPCYVTEISEQLGVSPKAVIDHLRKLEDAGLIESRTDDQRRKYFHIARNIRLEVTLAPYSFGMKSAYPASPSLDISACRHLSIEVSREQAVRPDGAVDPEAGDLAIEAADRADTGDISSLASQLDELEEIERELSLAQRWVQGRIATVLDSLCDVTEDAGYLDAEILATVASGTSSTDDISSAVDVPSPVVEDCLQRLAQRGLLRREDEDWRLA